MDEIHFCPSCGRQRSDGEKFCAGCGRAFLTQTVTKGGGIKPAHVFATLIGAIILITAVSAIFSPGNAAIKRTNGSSAILSSATATPVPSTPTLLPAAVAPTDQRTNVNPIAVQYYNAAVTLGDANPGLAEQNYKLAIQSDPTLGEAYGNLGVLKVEQEDWDQAEEYLKKAISLIEKNGTVIAGESKKQAMATYTAGLAAVEIGRMMDAATVNNISEAKAHLTAAEGYLDQALQLDPNDSHARVAQRKLDQAKQLLAPYLR